MTSGSCRTDWTWRMSGSVGTNPDRRPQGVRISVDEYRLTVVTPSLASIPSRRDVLRGLAGSGLGLGAVRLPAAAIARKKKKKNKKAKPNAFGCLNVGDPCKHANQCCSGVCKGKRGKKRCHAHDTGGCKPSTSPGTPCTSSSGVAGQCYTTTGGAGYCGVGDCYPCAKDADCRAVCGPRAACVVRAAECLVGTGCRGPDGEVCPL
jgi:hypothetical protein